MVEEFRVIKGHEDYLISSFGKVFSVKRGKYLTLCNNGKGYFYVQFGKKSKHYYVHRLVAQAFIPNPNNLDTIDHIDGNPSNNKVNNLQWLSRGDNVSRFHREQQTKEQREHYKVVHRESIKKATEVCKKPVICIETGKVYESSAQAGRELNIDQSCINKTCRGENKQTHGLHFKYLLE